MVRGILGLDRVFTRLRGSASVYLRHQSGTSGGDLSYTGASVDDEAVYLNVAGESSKGRVYGLGSVGRKKRRYGAPVLARRRRRMWCRGRVRCRYEQLRKVMDFIMHGVSGMDMDEIGLAQRTTTTTATTTATSRQEYRRK
ncbi:hypothetical protein Syun_018934 [Stephania yunnanensis]|uniref:Uncharacterized protein n=1 Tax=Stephania yunnanensis TaxID=152371 RepID=A0AAP0IT56_9MAGN